MKDEERNTGTVQLSTYLSYCKAAGGLFLIYCTKSFFAANNETII